jgi:hypothetical protein
MFGCQSEIVLAGSTPRPVIAEIKRDDVVFARVYDIRGSSISSPAPQFS